MEGLGTDYGVLLKARCGQAPKRNLKRYQMLLIGGRSYSDSSA